MDKLFGIHADALRLRGQRAELLAANIANAETPNYKARDFNFHEVLQRTAKGYADLRMTNMSHMHGGSGMSPSEKLLYRIPSQPNVDGNTVDMQIERSEFMQNSIRYQASLRFLNGRIGTLLTAIKGEI